MFPGCEDLGWREGAAGCLSGGMISLHEGRGARTRKAQASRVLVLGLTVLGCEPRIWRRVAVKESMRLARLHDAIQVLFDWFDYQTHVFTLEDMRLGNPVKREDVQVDDDRDVTLADVELARRGLAVYDYHFGEGWRVEVRVEQVLPFLKGEVYPRCLDGARAGPPEDCGGVEAYHDMLACIAEPTTELGREWSEWLGPDYDAERCDLSAINKALRKLAK